MSFLDTINITEYPEHYDRLVERITRTVEQSQQHPGPLPSIIIMSKRQHKMLRRYPAMSTMFGSKQKAWLTPHNIMEVVIQ